MHLLLSKQKVKNSLKVIVNPIQISSDIFLCALCGRPKACPRCCHSGARSSQVSQPLDAFMGYVHYTFSGQGDLGLRLKLLPVLHTTLCTACALE
jgi:hypothetical protein